MFLLTDFRKSTVILAEEGEKVGEHHQEDKTNENESNEEGTEPHTTSEDIPAPEPERMDVQNTQQNRKTLKPNGSIQCKIQTTHEWTKAKVLGGARKTTSKTKHWYNHLQEDANREKENVNLEQVQ